MSFCLLLLGGFFFFLQVPVVQLSTTHLAVCGRMGWLQHRSIFCSHTFSITCQRKEYLLVPSSTQSSQTHVATGILPKFCLRSYYLNILGGAFMSQIPLSDQSYWRKVQVQIFVSFSLPSDCGPNGKTQSSNSLCPSAGTCNTLLPSSQGQYHTWREMIYPGHCRSTEANGSALPSVCKATYFSSAHNSSY